MRALLNLIRWMLLGLFRSKTSLEAEILALRHQLNVLRRASPRRPVFSNFDRMIFVCLYRIAPRILDALTIVEPETVIRWHRAGFRSFWRWKSLQAPSPSVGPRLRIAVVTAICIRLADEHHTRSVSRRTRLAELVARKPSWGRQGGPRFAGRIRGWHAKAGHPHA